MIEAIMKLHIKIYCGSKELQPIEPVFSGVLLWMDHPRRLLGVNSPLGHVTETSHSHSSVWGSLKLCLTLGSPANHLCLCVSETEKGKMKLFKACVQTLCIYAGLERPRKGLTLQTLEECLNHQHPPVEIPSGQCWSSEESLCFSEFRLKVTPCSYFSSWCFESVPFSNTVAKCSSPWRRLCALHVRNGWILYSFGELHIKVLWLSFCWRWLFSCLLQSHFTFTIL